MTNKGEKIRQILVMAIFDSRSLSQKKHKHGAVLNKNIYNNIFMLFIDILQEFLRTDSFAKQVTQ